MEPAITVFQPDNSGDQVTLILSLLIAAGAFGAMILLLRRPGGKLDRNRMLLLAMLAFFAFIIAGGTAFFSWWSARKVGPVSVFADAIETPYGKANFADIRNAFIETETERSLLNANITTASVRLLIIEEKDGRTHVLSETNYPIDAVLAALKKAVKARDPEGRGNKG
jgi:hypothetical protein